MDVPRNPDGRVDSIDIIQLMKMLPHRYPMLMIDRLDEIVRDQSAVGIKNVTVNEPCFQGHFPRRPIMPGVLIIEAMAQTAAALVVYSMGGIDRRRPLPPAGGPGRHAARSRPKAPQTQERLEIPRRGQGGWGAVCGGDLYRDDS
jgi:hypothetical protein